METVEIDGVRLAHQLHGQGDPVVLVGSTGMPPVVWEYLLVPALIQAGYQAVTFASRGVTPSDGPAAPYSVTEMAADTARLIEDASLGSCRLVGVSLGGFIAEELSRTRQELVGATVLIASAGPTTAIAGYTRNADRSRSVTIAGCVTIAR